MSGTIDKNNNVTKVPFAKQAFGFVAVLLLCLVAFSARTDAHPHVFVDGGVDLVLDEEGFLEALRVTWLYDEFETLYILSSHGLTLGSNGELSEQDREELIRLRSEWPKDFDGSAHLLIEGRPVDLEWPTNLDGDVIDGRLKLTFTRKLVSPEKLAGLDAEVAFYESTYFFAFSITKTPEIFGAQGMCQADVLSFEPNTDDATILDALAKLGREETPDTENVGALFADKLVVRCA